MTTQRQECWFLVFDGKAHARDIPLGVDSADMHYELYHDLLDELGPREERAFFVYPQIVRS